MPEEPAAHLHRMEAALKEKRRAAQDLLEKYEAEWDYSGLGRVKTIKY